VEAARDSPAKGFLAQGQHDGDVNRTRWYWKSGYLLGGNYRVILDYIVRTFTRFRGAMADELRN